MAERPKKFICKQTPPLKCYNTFYRKILRKASVRVPSLGDLPPAGELATTKLISQLHRSTFVVAVLSGPHPGPVLFELGVALGIGKSVFVVAADRDRLAPSLLALPYVVASPADGETLSFHLEPFIANLTNTPEATSTSVLKRNLATVADEERAPRPRAAPQKSKRPPSPDGLTAETRVITAFHRVGATVSVGPEVGPDARADMIIWLPEDDLSIAGPALVEVKTNLSGHPPQAALQQTLSLLEKSHLRTGLIITGQQGARSSAYLLRGSYIYVLSVDELERLAFSGGLVRELRRVRNKVA